MNPNPKIAFVDELLASVPPSFFGRFKMTVVDGKMSFQEMTPEEIRLEDEKSKAREAERISAGGCDHVGDWVHDYDPDSRLGDAYYCSKCGELMQVG
jgi:hypothetical protein